MSSSHEVRSVGTELAKEDYGFAVNLMQFLVVPAFVLDTHGRVLIWNKACERLTGVAATEVIGTNQHWRGFYDSARPCLSDLIVENRIQDMDTLYAAHEDATDNRFGLRAENWCVMPRLGTERYLYIDAGPIFNTDGTLLAVVETLRDMTVQKRAQIELERLTIHDGLTGVVNRRGFDEKLKTEWADAARHGQSVALLMVDVDHFKRFNDTYGHRPGDECLKTIASVLKESVLRPSDIVARYGGEEFAVILPSIDSTGAEKVASRIVEAVSKRMIPHSCGEGGRVTVSVGGASAAPEPRTTPEKLIEMADSALYQAKHAGRNRVCIHA